VLHGVDTHNSAYDVPDILEAVNAGNWFLEQKDEGEAVNHFSIDTVCGILLGDPECLRVVRGWVMASEMPVTEKMTLTSRLTNYQAMWGDRKITELPVIKRLMKQEDLDRLDKTLRRVKKPE